MREQLEITEANGNRRVVAVRDRDFVLGADAFADVRVEGRGIEPRHLRFVRTGGGVRVEPVRAGGTVAVNGEQLFCKDLRFGDVRTGGGVRVEPVRAGGTVAVNGEQLFCKDLRFGDVIELGGVQLRWLEPDPPPPPPVAPARTAAKKRQRPPEREPSRPRRRTGVPTWLPVLAVAGLVLAVAVMLLRHFSGSTWPSSPQHYVDLARSQLANHQAQRALDTLAFALREAAGATREEALRLEADIRRLMLETSIGSKVITARREYELLESFAARYLTGSIERPAAREFVRLCDQWLERHQEVCSRHSDGMPLLKSLQEQRTRHVALAAIGQPDTAADVVFAARSRLRFQWRDYRGAVAKLDAFLAANPGDATVTSERATMIADGEKWVQGKLRNIDLLLERKDSDNAGRDLDELERWSMLPEWSAPVAERRQKLAAIK